MTLPAITPDPSVERDILVMPGAAEEHLRYAAEHLALAALHVELGDPITEETAQLAGAIAGRLAGVEQLYGIAAEVPDIHIVDVVPPVTPQHDSAPSDGDDELKHDDHYESTQAPQELEPAGEAVAEVIFDPATKKRYNDLLTRVFEQEEISDLTDTQLQQLVSAMSDAYLDMSIVRISAQGMKDRMEQLQLFLDGLTNGQIAERFQSTGSAISVGRHKALEGYVMRTTLEERRALVASVRETHEVVTTPADTQPINPADDAEVTTAANEFMIGETRFQVTAEERQYLQIIEANGELMTVEDVVLAVLGTVNPSDEILDNAEDLLMSLYKRGILSELVEMDASNLTPVYAINPNAVETQADRTHLVINDIELFLEPLDIQILKLLASQETTVPDTNIAKHLGGGERLPPPEYDRMIRSIKKYLVTQGLVRRKKYDDSNGLRGYAIRDDHLQATRVALDRL